MLPIQQQSVLFLAARGPDGIAKSHPCKRVQRAYRATVLKAAKYARCLKYGEKGDSFMCLAEFANDTIWSAVIEEFFRTADSLPHHFFMHLVHGAEIIGYKHPLPVFRMRWIDFYRVAVKDFHLTAETEKEMDARLSDWDQAFWPKAGSMEPQHVLD